VSGCFSFLFGCIGGRRLVERIFLFLFSKSNNKLKKVETEQSGSILYDLLTVWCLFVLSSIFLKIQVTSIRQCYSCVYNAATANWISFSGSYSNFYLVPPPSPLPNPFRLPTFIIFVPNIFFVELFLKSVISTFGLF